jgi:hypothetical protein
MAPVKSITDAYVGAASIAKSGLDLLLAPLSSQAADSGSSLTSSPFSYMEVGKTVHAGAHNHGEVK